MFDFYKEDKISEEGLFNFMKHASMRKTSEEANPTNLLGLNSQESDIFIEIFTN